MKKCFWLMFAVCVAGFVVGCSGGDTDQGPTKAEIDKGLEGQPPVDPNQLPPMMPGKGGGKGKAGG